MDYTGEGVALARLALDAATLRHQAIASNIANINSANYAPLRVNFEEQLAAVSTEQGKAGLQGVKPFIEHDVKTSSMSPQVALDTEIVKLNANTVHYQALLRAVAKYNAITYVAVTEGKR